MKVAITGATGFVGTELVKKLSQQGDNILILARNTEKARRLFPSVAFPQLEIVGYSAQESGEWQKALSGCDGVVNLAGEPISERWSSEYKQAILASRVGGTAKIVEAIAQANPRPQVLVNASAIGYYGTSETETFDESSPNGRDFLARVSQQWEAEARKVQALGVRLVICRLGIVLGNGGALAKMIPPFKLFAGGPIGKGRQWFSWIHMEDLTNLLIMALKRADMEGVYNATAPKPVRMSEFCQVLGEVLKRPSWLPVPPIALEILLGEGSKVVLEGQQVLPKAAQAIGFEYQYRELKQAIQDVVRE